MRRETVLGWVVSVLLHLVLLFALLLTSLPRVQQNPEYVELSWGAALPAKEEATEVPRPASPSETRPPVRARENVSTPPRRGPSSSVQLPERRLPDLAEDAFVNPRIEKQEVAEAHLSDRPTVVPSEKRTSERRTNISTEREKSLPAMGTGRTPEVADGRSGESSGAEIARGVSYAIQWLEGGTRRKIAGDLPEYPQGVSVDAQVKIQALVMPDGTVKVIGPLQKGNMKLEDAAMKELRFWRFEPLFPSQPQVEQPCVVTFRFTLK